jgi:hypothetical protein
MKNATSMETARPSFLHGTNEGRVNLPIKGPGEMHIQPDWKAKAQIETQNLLCLAMEQDEYMGGYKK